MITHRALAVVAVAVAAICAGTPVRTLAQEPGFIFSSLLDNHSFGFYSLGLTGIGPDGTIVFNATHVFDGPESLHALIQGAGFPVTIFDPTADLVRLGSATGSANASDTFVFSAYLANGGSGIYRVSTPGGAYETIGLSSTENLYRTKASINSAGTVVYTDDAFAGGAIFAVSSAGTRVQIAGGGSMFGSIQGSAVINDADAVVFGGTLQNGTTGLFATTAAGGTPTTIVDSSGPFGRFAFDPGTRPALGAHGEVAFKADLDDGTNGIFLGNIDGRTPIKIADSTGPIHFFALPAIGPNGQIVCRAYTDGYEGLYYADEHGPQLLIKYGDPLFGSTYVFGDFGTPAFADDGRIVFGYTLADGTSGFGLISPIPEPTAGSLAAAALLTLASMYRPHQQRGRVRVDRDWLSSENSPN